MQVKTKKEVVIEEKKQVLKKGISFDSHGSEDTDTIKMKSSRNSPGTFNVIMIITLS